MPYGTIQDHTRNILEAKLKGLDQQIEVEFDPDEEIESNSDYRVDVIYGGALDESFYVRTDAGTARVITDWVAEDCEAEAKADADHPTWDVSLYYPGFADEPELVYRRESKIA